MGLPDDRAADVVTTGAAASRARWAATPTWRRLALVAAVVIAATAVVVGVVAAPAGPIHRTRTVVDPGPPAAITVDAAGCPVTAECTISAWPPTQLQAALLRAFPGARVLAGQRTAASGPGRIYHTAIVGTLSGGVVISATAQCVPRGAPITEQTVRSANTSLDLAGNTVVHARQLSAIVPGAAGCSVHVYLDSPGGQTKWQAAAISFAHDPTAQVAPR